ncbi:PD-(D/E)XK nuclease-like domain-containing protein [Neobacillus drentensis]|uniref:PD-(D/E)XK nuclease-like domain-containing protein n=1 Tax=Neobacillus drentensis TaxID=220684 RepID=UPI0030007439
MKQLLKLTDENYFSLEADQQYMSVSQYKNFLKCESSALAQIQGKYTRPKSDALLFGSYVHSWLDGTIEKFKEENPELFSSKGATKGQLKATYQNANEMIKVLENDPFVMMALQGEKEVIMTGELFGSPWKIKMDVYNPQFGRFADLKTVKAIREKYWSDDIGYCSFVEAYGYITQMAVYSEIEKQNRGGDWLENFIVAVSKETPPDKAIITIDEESLAHELENIESKMERIIALKSGELEPKRCEKCEYCRRTKKITNVIHYLELIG